MQDDFYNEQELLLKIAEDDQQAFSMLVERYKNNIYTTSLRIIQSAEIAEEVVQDVFMVLWQKRVSLPAIENFPGYLYGISRRTILYALRNFLKQRERQKKGLPPELMLHQDTADKLLEKEYQGILQRAIQRLPSRQQQVYTLIRQEGLSRQETAAQLGISPETVKSNLEEAYRKVRAYCLIFLQDIPIIFFLLHQKNIF